MANIITTLKDGLSSSLSDLSWSNAASVGLRITAPTLPKNVVVLGKPLLTNPETIIYNPSGTSFSCNGVECYPRFICNNQTIYIKSVAKTATFDNTTKKVIGVTGDLTYATSNLSYYSRCYAHPGRDDFGIQVGFTTPVKLPAFSYEYVFLPKDADGIRLYTSVEPSGYKTTNYNIKATTKTDITSDSTHIVHFTKLGIQVSQFNFRQLKERAKATYWKIEEVTIDSIKQLAVIVGFDFDGLDKDASFANDGYFGGATEADDECCNLNILFGSRFQNSIGTGNITKFRLYADYGNTAHDYRFGVYADSSGEPGNLITDFGAIDIVDGWTEMSGLSAAVTNAAYYWLVFMVSARGSYIGYEDNAGYSGFYKSQTYGALPSSVGTHSNTTTNWMVQAWVDG
jgi:hypothetical protein